MSADAIRSCAAVSTAAQILPASRCLLQCRFNPASGSARIPLQPVPVVVAVVASRSGTGTGCLLRAEHRQELSVSPQPPLLLPPLFSMCGRG